MKKKTILSPEKGDRQYFGNFNKFGKILIIFDKDHRNTESN